MRCILVEHPDSILLVAARIDILHVAVVLVVEEPGLCQPEEAEVPQRREEEANREVPWKVEAHPEDGEANRVVVAKSLPAAVAANQTAAVGASCH